MNKIIKQILDKEMDRKEFLRMTGFIVLGIIGLPQFLALLRQSSNMPRPQPMNQRGYGSSPYGK